ncbi:uncharacterized protein PADG_06373 [Paracoccidioides brasiliensis Pb18]|uniref:Uncharacterized protein n=1 Tax=Paracoccidioides brasiliensis (strain Pb18) TaxID=502780 RepID=C1GGD6_PARBD|nr:uncharacterized protein PADG_06373 [Paracoccidioides brasiliensis Pb18]EEH50294.2 hypothetical protein PADG_06373 [Paracoccidioides brasiliensis Pb18]
MLFAAIKKAPENRIAASLHPLLAIGSRSPRGFTAGSTKVISCRVAWKRIFQSGGAGQVEMTSDRTAFCVVPGTSITHMQHTRKHHQDERQARFAMKYEWQRIRRGCKCYKDGGT